MGHADTLVLGTTNAGKLRELVELLAPLGIGCCSLAGLNAVDVEETGSSFAENAAVNTPVQGSAADVIKRAMIDLEQRLEESELHGEMLLQVHDELIVEKMNGTSQLFTNIVFMYERNITVISKINEDQPVFSLNFDKALTQITFISTVVTF